MRELNPEQTKMAILEEVQISTALARHLVENRLHDMQVAEENRQEARKAWELAEDAFLRSHTALRNSQAVALCRKYRGATLDALLDLLEEHNSKNGLFLRPIDASTVRGVERLRFLTRKVKRGKDVVTFTERGMDLIQAVRQLWWAVEQAAQSEEDSCASQK